MLRIENLTFTLAGKRLFEGASATVPSGHKVGLVGRNGSGKTTLLRLIRGELSPEGGRIELRAGARIGSVAQEVPGSDVSLLDTVLSFDAERTALLAEAADPATPPARIAEAQARLADIDAWSAEARAATILAGLGFPAEAQARPCSSFSGGWRMRVALAGVLFSRPDLLLLDEPTNYLDLEGALWFEGFLQRYPHTALVISHDRDLLDRAVGGILHLDGRRLGYWQGGYSQFRRQWAERRATQAAEARKIEARRAHLQSFVDRFRAKATKAAQAQSRLRMLERLAPVALAPEAPDVTFAFPEPGVLAPPIVTLEGAAAGYGGAPVLRRLSLRIDQDDRIALLGRNGEGKSTLARLIAGRLEPMGGAIRRARGLRIGYFAQHQIDELRPDESALAHVDRLRPDEPVARRRARLAAFGLGADQAGVRAADLSGGQKARLSLLLATIDAPHLLILDEPTNHLDIESREALAEALCAYGGAVIVVSHDLHLLSMVADRLWLVGDGTVRPYDGDLDDYRRLILSPEAPARPAPARPARAGSGAAPAAPATAAARPALMAELRRCEDRIGKLEAMRADLDSRLADPALYSGTRQDDLARLGRRRAEVIEALGRAEELWMAAQERLDAAEAGGAGGQ